MTRLVWFRNDLRVHDNPALAFARRDNEAPVVAVVFVFCGASSLSNCVRVCICVSLSAFVSVSARRFAVIRSLATQLLE